jgi:hypothetical protein
MGYPCRQHIYKLDYDLQKDFEPIGLVSVNPPWSPRKTFRLTI